MKSATSSPMRFEKVSGIFVVTCLNLQDKETKEHLGSMHQAESTKSFSDAKRLFWKSWKEEMPDYFLTPRNDAGYIIDLCGFPVSRIVKSTFTAIFILRWPIKNMTYLKPTPQRQDPKTKPLVHRH